MTMLRIVRDEGGFAFAVLLLVTLAVASLTGAAMVLGTNSRLITNAHERQDMLETVADDGLEFGRARLNANPSLYPDDGFVVLDSAQATDGFGNPIPGVTRVVYAGPVGITSGQYGVYGAIVSVARDAGRGIAVRRSQIMQESFSKYAYFTDIEPSDIAFGGGDQIYGPVHSNDDIKIYESRATFHKEVTTAGVVANYGQFRRSYGTFLEGVREGVPRIEMPQTAEFDRLRVQAQAGGTAFTAPGGPNPTGRAKMRIEFVALDLNGDGDTRDADEGFIRVYVSNDFNWVVGAVPENDMKNAETCGDFHGTNPRTFVSAREHTLHNYGHTWEDALNKARNPRCFLGGDSTLFGAFRENDGKGRWLRWNGPIDPRVANRYPEIKDFLFPITRALNPDFKGVIFVDGDVAISGTVRGRVTLAATGNIIIADDIEYVTNPSQGTCEDILGLFSRNDIVISNTPLNAPWKAKSTASYTTYDDSKDEWIHAFVLALNQFWVEDYDKGSDRHEPCDGTAWGRGCLYLTGGIVQRTRGAVGTITSSTPRRGTGYLKRYSYDQCGVSAPPPYFPTTGRFARSQYFDVDPVDFGDAASYFQRLQAGN